MLNYNAYLVKGIKQKLKEFPGWRLGKDKNSYYLYKAKDKNTKVISASPEGNKPSAEKARDSLSIIHIYLQGALDGRAHDKEQLNKGDKNV